MTVRNVRALVIANQKHDGLVDVDFVLDSAKHVHDMLTSRFGSAVTITEKINEGHAAVIAALDTLFANVTTTTDLVVVSFAGHGLEDKDAQGNVTGQAWGLAGPDELTDNDFASALEQLALDVEFVVVSDACVGAGIAQPGVDTKPAKWSPAERDIFAKQAAAYLKRQFQSLTKVFETAGQDDLICIAAASATGTVREADFNSLSTELQGYVAASASKGSAWTYQNLRADLAIDKTQGHVFVLEAPAAWLPEPALAENASATTSKTHRPPKHPVKPLSERR
jgi:hypothetical protein